MKKERIMFVFFILMIASYPLYSYKQNKMEERKNQAELLAKENQLEKNYLGNFEEVAIISPNDSIAK